MKNKLALCSRGQLGLITHNEKQSVLTLGHACHMAYVGIHLTDGPEHSIGDPWCAQNPIIVGELCSGPAGHYVKGFANSTAHLQHNHSAAIPTNPWPPKGFTADEWRAACTSRDPMGD